MCMKEFKEMCNPFEDEKIVSFVRMEDRFFLIFLVQICGAPKYYTNKS